MQSATETYSQNWEGLQEGKEANIKGSVKRDELWLKLRRCEKLEEDKPDFMDAVCHTNPRQLKKSVQASFLFSALNPHL